MKNLVIFVPYLNYIQTWVDPISPFLKQNDFNILILHCQSLSFGIAPYSDVDNECVAYDIGKMSIINIERLLIKIQPAAIIFFHFKSFADFIMLRISKHFDIKSIYIQHGLYYSKVFKFVKAKRLSSFLRYTFHLLQYVQLLLKAKLGVWKELKIAYRFFTKNELVESKYDHVILYSPYSLGIIQRRFNFKESQVKYSGYPIYRLQNDLIKIKNSTPPVDDKKILFIQEKFIPAHTSIGFDEEFQYFKNIIDICTKLGYEIEMRLHPRVDHDFYRRMLSSEAVVIDNNQSLEQQIASSDLIVGNMSTALFGAVLQKKTIIILYYPDFKPLTDIFTGIGSVANTLGEFKELLKRPDKLGLKLPLYDDFIDKYIGINNSYEHLATTIMDSINNNK